MVSKGIDAYCYITCTGCRVAFTVPHGGTERSQLDSWSRDHFEVDSGNIHPGFTGPFTFTVYDPEGNVLVKKTNNVSSLTGNLEDGSQMTNLSQMQSVITANIVVTYGFYDAGSGEAGLPNADQCWVTVTPNWSKWLGIMARPGSLEAEQPFTILTLPSAHDVGMNRTDNIMHLLDSQDNFIAVMNNILSNLPGVGSILSAIGSAVLDYRAEDIVTALAFTQKDSLNAMLQIGARYFEFRPAHISSFFPSRGSLGDKLYFTHYVIPGQAFDSWLAELVSFLEQNETEIVVVQIRSDGVHSSCQNATTAEVNTYVSQAIQGTTLVQGSVEDLGKSIGELRYENKRLILLTELGQYSTYGGGNTTLSGGPIVNEFANFLSNVATGEANNQIAVWQCQATSTEIKDVAVYCVTHANGATSSLLATKAMCDAVTHPWLQKSVYPTMPTKLLQVIMNDFFDGATSEIAIWTSRRYLDDAVAEDDM